MDYHLTLTPKMFEIVWNALADQPARLVFQTMVELQSQANRQELKEVPSGND